MRGTLISSKQDIQALQGVQQRDTMSAFQALPANLAKNAAIVSVEEHFIKYPIDYSQTGPMSGMLHFSDHIWEDIPPVHNYLNRMIDDIHCEGALVYFAGDFGYSRGTSSTGGGGGAPGGAGPGGPAPGGTAPAGAEPGRGAGARGGMPGGAAGTQGGMPGGAEPGRGAGA